MNYFSVVTTSDAGNGVGYTGIRVRGSDTRVNVTINGIPYNDSESHGTYQYARLCFFFREFTVATRVGTSTNGAGALAQA
jgi:iron complex outermembrane receptor protein